MKCNRCCDSGRKDGLVEWETPDCVWWISWSVPGGQGWKEHHRPRGEADTGMEPHAVGTDNHQRWPFLKVMYQLERDSHWYWKWKD